MEQEELGIAMEIGKPQQTISGISLE